ncbi:cache domain-containing sensor histidine kinase [Cohnella phaseoli]|uniref:histidine kinase n=1 Tax=Cohnella phaseoli TaxID=456490 RepID=A0A3D9IAM3_9BACL|nr:sensor histidine kinase [Cohnella phaseoli]RED58761.1 two-component system sensor histidine kinase YesM [Cohnella phaseoli]
MNLFRFRTIQSNIAAALALLIVILALVMGFSAYRLSTSAVQRTAQDFTAELIKQVNSNIQSYVNNMENISLLALNHRGLSGYLSGVNDDDAAVTDFLKTIMLSRKDIASIGVFGYNGRFVSDGGSGNLNPYVDVKEQSWYSEAKEGRGKVFISPSHVQPVFKEDYRWVVSLSREIRSPDNTKGLGILLVDLNFSVINDILNGIELGKRGYVYIIDRSGRVVYHPQQQLLYSNLKTEKIEEALALDNGSFITNEGGQSRIYTVQDSGFGWKIVGVSYVSELVNNKGEMQTSFFILGGISLVVALLLYFLLSRNLTRPIHQMQKHMSEVEKGNFDIQVPVDSTREIGMLDRAFNLMVVRIRELMAQVVKEQEFKRKSELNALQAQINPHFLYNTLDSIVWMAENDKSAEVVRMTSALARLFRASISKGSELVPVRNEVEHISNYLTIQKMRYRDKLDFCIDVDDAIKGNLTLKVLLQPLVENAIYHGIKNKYGTGTIRITGEREGETIVLRVNDNGVGMDEETRKSLLSPATDAKQGKGVGLMNVHERIRLYFGKIYGLTIDSEPDEGTTVTVKFPVLDKPAGSAESSGKERGS